jgi:gamma-glutamyltranspeptidase/glutathione hydrolase
MRFSFFSWVIIQLCFTQLLLFCAPAAIVTTFHPESTRAAVETLKAGGNAFDAFVAATFTEYVVNEGGTSAAGSLGALIYDARTHTAKYLDAEFNGVLDPNGQWEYHKAWTGSDREAGRAVLVPGAVAGLQVLAERYGRRHFAEDLQPAIALARDGFRVAGFYRAGLIANSELLQRIPYARRTFYPGGHALNSGDLLKQPELAEFLSGLAQQGAAYMYHGKWAVRAIQTVQAAGGRMTLRDLAQYRAEWREPWRIEYRGREVLSSSGRAFGGLWGLVALKTLEHTEIARLGHFSSSAEALELMMRTARQALGESWIFDYRELDRPETLKPRLTKQYTQRIWDRVRTRMPASQSTRTGIHSYQIIIVDAEGNGITGTNTHESLAWGSGMFVEGVPLNTAGRIPWATAPGERQISPFSMHLVLNGGRLSAVSGAFSSSLLEASFQFLVNLIDYRLPPQETVTRPRFGTIPYDPAAALTNTIPQLLEANRPNWLDPRVGADIVRELAARGVTFAQKQPPGMGGWVDTGLGAVVTVGKDGKLEGAITPWVEIAGPPGAVQIVEGLAPH